jgi:hypothetical protein
MVSGKLPLCQGRRMMSPDEVRARYRLYVAYYMSCGIGPYRRMLASLVRLRHSDFKESFAQIAGLNCPFTT